MADIAGGHLADAVGCHVSFGAKGGGPQGSPLKKRQKCLHSWNYRSFSLGLLAKTKGQISDLSVTKNKQ